MYFVLTGQIKNRLIEELQTYWATQPRYAAIVPNIQGKYRYKDRPHLGMTVKAGTGNPVSFSADNFVGVDMSFCYLARVKSQPGNFLEWVREDPLAIQRHGGKFPSPPGLYFIQVKEITRQADVVVQYGFQVTPYYAIKEVPVLRPDGLFETRYSWAPGSLRIRELPGDNMVPASACVSLDPENGLFRYPRTLGPRQTLEVEYRTPGTLSPVYPCRPEWADNQAIPGVTLAFGQELNAGDEMVVVVQPHRLPASLVYGGQWALSLDVDVVARDVHAQQYIADRTVMHLLTVVRPRWAEEGINLAEISLSGESEEQADETGDDYFFMSNFSMSIETEWQMYIPLEFTLRAVQDLPLKRMKEWAALEDTDFTTQAQSNLQLLQEADLQQVTTSFSVISAGFPTISAGSVDEGAVDADL